MRDITILISCLAAMSLSMAAIALFNNGQSHISHVVEGDWVFSRMPTEREYAISDESGDDIYIREALLFEQAIAEGEPAAVASRAIEFGNFGFIAVSYFGGAAVPGISCVTPVQGKGPLVRRYYGVSDYRTGPPQDRRDDAIHDYAVNYNQFIVQHQKTAFRDICWATGKGDETVQLDLHQGWLPTYSLERIKNDNVLGAMPHPYEGDLPVNSLIDAARHGDAVTVKKLVSKKNVNNVDGFAMTALGWAVLRGHSDVAKVLIDGDADLNKASGMASRTPLIWAVYADRKEIFDLLLNAGADPNATGLPLMSEDSEVPDNYDREALIERPVYTAAIRGAEYYVRKLRDAGARLEFEHEFSPLSWAVVGGDFEIVKLLLDLGADPNHSPQPSSKYDDNFLPPLAIAAGSNNTDLMTLLLSFGADIDNVSNKGGGSALQTALDNNNLEAVRFLFESDADPNVGRLERALGASTNAESALHIAAFFLINKKFESDPLRLLIEAGADLDEVSGYQRDTALGYAADWLIIKAVEMLIDAGADLNRQNEDGLSPLMGAVQGEYTTCKPETKRVVRALLSAGADATVQDYEGRTAFYFRCAHLVGEELISAGLDVNSKDLLGRTAIFSMLSCLKANPPSDIDNFVAFNTCKSLLAFLINNGADLTSPDIWGVTPLQAAEYYGLLDIVEKARAAAH